MVPLFIKNEIYDYTEQNFVSIEYPEVYNVKYSKVEYIYFRKISRSIS
jgi:hypothetical protein